MLVADGAACIFEETGELIGCEHIMASRAITPELGRVLEASVAKAARYYATLGYGSFAAGNAEGGLSTIEEKSMGAYAKSGASPLSGLIKPGDIPPRGASTSSMSCPTARSSASPTSTTMPRSRN
jgi:altronate hydrolase